jgi:adenylylsulfate kinase-like enzyme
MILHFIGQPGCGKTTLAKSTFDFITSINSIYRQTPILIDGDDLREIFANKDYSEEGRRRNLTNGYNIARFLEAKGFTPILSMVSPYRDLREELKSTTSVKEFYLTTDQVRGRENFFVKEFEEPLENFIHLNTSNSIQSCLEQVYDNLAENLIETGIHA